MRRQELLDFLKHNSSKAKYYSVHLKLRIENHDPVMEVDDLKLDELRKVRELIHDLSDIGTEVTIKDSTGIITLEVLDNIISSYEGITADIEELDTLTFDEED